MATFLVQNFIKICNELTFELLRIDCSKSIHSTLVFSDLIQSVLLFVLLLRSDQLNKIRILD